MNSTLFEQGPIRPPDEANSLLIRTTRGCPWNRCAFCTLYKGARFSIRSVADIKKDILAIQQVSSRREYKTCFLQDGDSFAMKTGDLIEVLQAIKQAFPSVTQISSYGRAQTMIRKSAAEMQEIADAGLNLLYCGMESGSAEVLQKVNKGVTPETIVESSSHAQAAGMGILLFAILGLGGKELSPVHTEETAKLINAINPADIRLLTLAAKPETALGAMVRDGSFTLLSEVEMIQEQRRILSQLEGINSNYGNYHAINLLTELNGKLPRDKADFLATMDQFLGRSHEDQMNFIFGSRRGYYARYTDLNRSDLHARVEVAMAKFKANNAQSLEAFFHDCRQSWI